MTAPRSRTYSRSAALFCLAWAAVYTLLFAPYFTGSAVGGDYAYFLPKLFDEHVFARTSGWLTPQWFTPSFCGGFPGLPNPQSTYWSVPHLLTAVTGPTHAVFATMILFGALGGLGLYLLLALFYPGWPALIGALLFAANGYHVARMLEGHLGHHSFMLAPLIAWLLIRGRPDLRAPATWWPIALAALLLAYVVIAAGGPVMPQVLASIVMLLAFAALFARLPLRSGLARLVLAGSLSALVLGPVLLATVAFMLNNPRSWFPLPQFATAGDAVWHGLSIMLSPWRDTAALRETLVQTGTLFEWHELEYGLTFIPLILIPAGILSLRERHFPAASPRAGDGIRLAPLILFTALAISPFVLNTYQGPEFIQVLRDLPVIGSTSNLFRWFVLPMLAIALLTAAATHRLIGRSAYPDRTGFLLATACLATITFHYAHGIDGEMRNRSVSYDNSSVEAAYVRFQERPEHVIETIGFRTDVFRNDSFLDGQSAQYCYEAALGYQLEGLEYTTAPGPALELIDGRYNMNNPSCYVYPFENRCRRGDRFSKDRTQDVVALTHYQNIDFEVPNLHRALAVIAPITLVLLLVAILVPGIWRMAVRAGRPRPTAD